MNWIVHIDHQIFFFINRQLANHFFDIIMPVIRNKLSWIPLYLLIFTFIVWKHPASWWKMLLAILFTIALTDGISSHIIKPLFHRIRPCHAAGIAGHARLLLSHCSGGYSFTSSHAANHFGLALIFSLLLAKHSRWIWPAFLFWATLISFAQIYVGVHYPADVAGGAITGIACGFISWYFYQKYLIRNS